MPVVQRETSDCFSHFSAFGKVGTHTDSNNLNVSAPKDKKNRSAEESANQRPKREKQKLIRLDDLIPKKDVKGGGGQHLFGVTDTTETEEKGK